MDFDLIIRKLEKINFYLRFNSISLKYFIILFPACLIFLMAGMALAVDF